MGKFMALATAFALFMPTFSSLAAEPPAAVPLEGPTWLLTGLPGHELGAPGASGRQITARFEGGRISGFSGCNRYTGGYTVDRDRVTLGSLAGTMMACPGDAMAIESAFKGSLAGTLQYAITGDRLVLTPASGAALTFEREPKPTLEGVKWEVTGFNNGRQAVVSPVLDTHLTLSFQNGKLSGSSGCNTFSASYKAEGNRIVVGPAAATRKMCAGKGVMEQERQFLTALETATLWDISAGMLDMHRPDGERVLTANRRGK